MIFNYLYKHATNNWYFPTVYQNKREHICHILLRLLYHKRYEQTVLIEKLQYKVNVLERENKQYLFKIDALLRICAGDEEHTSPHFFEHPPEDNPFAELSDSDFMNMLPRSK